MTVEDCEKHAAELLRKLQLSQNCEEDLLERLQRSEKRQYETQQRLTLEIEKRLIVEAQLGSRPPAKRRTLDEVFVDYFLVNCSLVTCFHIILKILFFIRPLFHRGTLSIHHSHF